MSETSRYGRASLSEGFASWLGFDDNGFWKPPRKELGPNLSLQGVPTTRLDVPWGDKRGN